MDNSGRSRFEVDPAGSALLVEARSNVGAVSFGTRDIAGSVDVVRTGDRIDTALNPAARLSVPLSSLQSGNALYDAELHKRLAVQRYPTVAVDLLSAEPGVADGYSVSGELTIHGVTATLHGAVTIDFPEPDTVLVTGEQIIDIRDFDIELPSVLILRIYPDVKVSLHLLARLAPMNGRVG